MGVRVLKFGGTSVATKQTRELVIHHIERELRLGHRLAVVVSAMGRSGDPYATDTLLSLAAAEGGEIPARERDLLLGCGEIISSVLLCTALVSRGIQAVALTGGQAGIMTGSQFGEARIEEIRTERIQRHMDRGEVVIVTGFQGQNDEGDLTTLGRGGSDTSATALGAALGAEMVDIYTDVNGILTADPRIVKDARPLTVVGYAEICNMARQGPRSFTPER